MIEGLIKMEKVNFIGFDRQDVSKILEDLGIETKKIEKKNFILDELKEIKKCEMCGNELTTRNLGNISHGSHKMLCDNPICFISYLEKNKFYLKCH